MIEGKQEFFILQSIYPSIGIKYQERQPFMDTSITELQMLWKVIIAAFLGGLVGLEREFAERPAGLRTHMLVGAAAAFFVMLATHMISSFERRKFSIKIL